MRFPLAMLILALSVATATGAATNWVELAPDTRVRLIAAEAWSGEGRTLLALELDMPADTKTYWRVPGESGIPTEIDLSGSSGVRAMSFIWPHPLIEQKRGYTDFVYYGPTVIPFELVVDGPDPHVQAAVMMGICSDICLPATAEFTLPLAIGNPDTAQGLRIAQAVARAPLPWAGTEQPVGSASLEPAGEHLRIEFDPAIVDPGSVVVDARAAGLLLGAPQKSPEPGIVLLPVLGGGDGPGAEPILITFMTRDGPFEVWRKATP